LLSAPNPLPSYVPPPSGAVPAQEPGVARRPSGAC
jgi:hypothetical protein